MFYRTLLPFILAICQYSKSLECAYINVSFSATNIAVNGSFEITLIGVFPNDTAVVPYLACGHIDAGRILGFATYNFFLKKMKLDLPLPVKFAGRIKIRSDKTAAIVPVRISDENQKFGCSFSYHDSSGTKQTLKSHSATIENVYAVPVIDSSPLKQVTDVNMGEPTLIVCSVRSRPASNITWSYDAEITGVGSQRVHKSGEYYYITTGTFNVTNPSKFMNGKKVRCNATHQFGSPVVQSTTLHIQYKPDSIQFTSPALKPVNGKSVALNCSSTGVPTPKYRMYKIINGNGTLIADSTTGIHTIPSINYVNYGGYNATVRCVPYNIVGHGPTKDLHFDIQVPAMVNFTVAKKTITENESTTIECKAHGNPPAVATLKGPKDENILLINGVANLTRVKRANGGVYTCTANNNVGSSASKAETITVQYKPESVTFTSSTSDPINESPVTLTCASNGIPAPSYKFESIIGSNTQTVQDTTSGTYSIARINYADYVNYSVSFRCMAYNTIGSASSKVANLSIKVKPVIAVSGDLKIKEGSNVTFNCTVTAANPVPTITWKNSTDKTVSHSNGVVRLTFVSTKQSGKYSCHAKNKFGEDTKIFTLTVTAKKNGGDTGKKTGEGSSNTGLIVGVVVGIIALLLIVLIIYFVDRKTFVCGSRHRLAHEMDFENKDDGHIAMEGVTSYKNPTDERGATANARAPEESPRVNESASKEPILPDQGAEKPYKFSESYTLDNGTVYSRVVTRGKDHAPEIIDANKTPKDKSKEESQYAEIAAFNLRGNIRSPSDIPERTEYATLEECGPIAKHPPTSENENVAQIMGTPTEI